VCVLCVLCVCVCVTFDCKITLEARADGMLEIGT
jgi:hypothetical protein